jgi:hypothetical protein
MFEMKVLTLISSSLWLFLLCILPLQVASTGDLAIPRPAGPSGGGIGRKELDQYFKWSVNNTQWKNETYNCSQSWNDIGTEIFHDRLSVFQLKQFLYPNSPPRTVVRFIVQVITSPVRACLQTRQ